MSIKIKVYNQNAESTGEMELSPKVFGLKINPALVHQAVVTQMANKRKVIAHTKNRSEVRGGGRKPWAQKGTGRARHGSSRSPIWKGGGVTFGPRNDRNFKMRINKKMRQNAMLMVLSDKLANNYSTIVDKFEINEFKTKIFNKIISGFENKIFIQPNSVSPAPKAKVNLKKQATTEVKKAEAKKKAFKRNLLIIADQPDEKLSGSVRNLTGVELINTDNINILDLLKYKNLIFTKAAIEKIEKRYSK